MGRGSCANAVCSGGSTEVISQPTSSQASEDLISLDEVQRRVEQGEELVILDGEVYDLRPFMDDHPGGRQVVMEYLGEDISTVFRGNGKGDHSHSDSAFNILKQLSVGRISLCRGESDNSCVSSVHDVDPGSFQINSERPLVWQVGHLGEKYDEWAHTPDMSSEPLRFFESDILEFFSGTSWWVVPLLWLPVAFAALITGMQKGATYVTLTFFFGSLIWFFLEYCMHRVVFHHQPHGYWPITIHFLFHGCHHRRPMDRNRLVFPPAAALPFVVLVFYSYQALMPVAMAYTLFGGSLTGYVIYECTHFHVHHSQFTGYLGSLKTTHLAHHYKDHSVSFGITSCLFDYVFNTLPPAKESIAGRRQD